jgi:hypothetical protein
VKLAGGIFAVLVIDVATVTSEIERRMAAACFGNFHAGVVAGEAEVFLRLAGNRFQKLILIVRTVWIVTGDAVTDSGTVYSSFDLRRIFVGMTLKAQFAGRYGQQLDVCNVTRCANFVASGAADGDRGMYRLSLGFRGMALETLAVVGLSRKWWVRRCVGTQTRNEHQRRDHGELERWQGELRRKRTSANTCRQSTSHAKQAMPVIAHH